MLFHKRVPPLHAVAGTRQQEAAFLAAFQQKHAQALKVFHEKGERKLEEQVPGRKLQRYYCIGCDVAQGHLREELLSFGAYPLYQAAMEKLAGQQLTLQCYFPQTYEEKAGPGPGGILGTVWVKDAELPDVSFSRCWKYWRWVDANVPEYTSEEEAETELWRLSFAAFSRGKAWLRALPEELPPQGVAFPDALKDDLHALLGVAAMQRLVTKHLGKNLVLLNASRVIAYQHLSWQAGL